MKKFLKKYLWLIIVLLVEILLFIMGTIFFACLILATFSSGILMLFFAYKSKQKYNDLKEIPEDNNYFDATELDYDEDIYYFGNNSSKFKEIGKFSMSKFGALMPTIVFSVFGLSLISFSIIGILKIFI